MKHLAFYCAMLSLKYFFFYSSCVLHSFHTDFAHIWPFFCSFSFDICLVLKAKAKELSE